jgi:septum site-determining protein MinD
MQRPVSTGRRIVVAAARGGAGRTTLTALMGTAFATRRADPVLVVDAAPWPGSLTWRLGLIGVAPLSATAPRVMGPQGRRLADLDGVLARTPAGLWCLPGGDGEQVPVHVVRDATRALSRLCAVTVTDTGEGLGAASTGSVLSDAHAVVLAAPSTPDGVVATAASLARLGVGSPGLLSRVVVVLVELDPSARSALRVSDAVTALASWGVAVLPLPHDRHLAAGAAVAGRRLAAATVRATHHICAETLERAVQA